MILKFEISNFRSIKDPLALYMEPTNFKEHEGNIVEISNVPKVLTSSVIYGANASGKSNILKALDQLRNMVVKSDRYKPDSSISFYDPFRLDEMRRKEPVSFELEFIAKNTIRYLFSLSFSEKEILDETLHFYPGKQKSLLYSRKRNAIKYGSHYKGEKKSIEKKLLNNQLFISKAVTDNVEILNPVFSYFNKSLKVLPFINKGLFYSLYAERLANEENKTFHERFNRLISALDTGIVAVRARKVGYEQLPEEVPNMVMERLQEYYSYNIKTVHKVFEKGKESGTVLFDKNDESEGTQNLFVLAGIILDALDEGTALVVDEFEKNLHPHITKFLIQLFHNPRINKKNAQLIFATHDTSQLDNDTFRRDQIWFTEKDEYGATSLFSLADIKGIRNTVPYDKWYNSGKFGATPIINELELFFDDAQEAH